MTPVKITRNVLAGYLNCKYKAHLMLTGQHGAASQYETFQAHVAKALSQKASEWILSQAGKVLVLQNQYLTYDLLKEGADYILDATTEDNQLSLHFDGLKRINGSSRLGVFHYIPLLFHCGDTIYEQEKHLLAIYGHVISGIQGKWPSFGIVICGPHLKTKKLKMAPNHPKTSQILHELQSILQRSIQPPMILNDHCYICEFQQRCHAQAKNEDNLSLLKGMTEKEIKKQNRRGIFTVTQLSYTYRPRRKSAISAQARPHHNFALQALAIRDKKVFILSVPALSKAPVNIYLDIEGIPDRRFYYLIGALVCTGTSVVHHSFWADNESQEFEMLRNFLNLVDNFDTFQVFHYGAYEAKFLKRMRSCLQTTELIDKIFEHSTNILSLIYGHIYFPVYSNSLKHIAPFLGYAWVDDSFSGINSTVWRHQWESTASPEIKDRLLTYNRDDCAALKLVTDFIQGLTDKCDKNNAKRGLVAENVEVSHIPDMKMQFTRPNWGKPQFVRADFDYINRCSYFDYQREKIYVRTITRNAKHKYVNKRHTKRLGQQEEVVIPSSSCPNWGTSEVARSSERIQFRQFFDLKIRSTSVRRGTKRIGSYKYHCKKCGTVSFPNQYLKMAKYGHSLKSWAIYEHVAHRTSFENLEETFRDLYNLPVYFRDIHVFKRIMADYYKETYRGIMRRLAAGSILHADETEVHLKHVGKGYVWVFTNLEEVLYTYKTSRDSKFLGEMFAGFSGVLISDFYTGYDSLGCPSQKCLIHLIRDLNTQLLSNPFDEEFKRLVGDFGGLLRRIITTIDRYGLKRYHLAKHQREVDKYFNGLAANVFCSEAARAVQDRLKRNKDSLFTFLKYDGVPWNNNNAEHAVKRFAYYREITDGQLSEAGLIDYLVLLSIEQTCRYKGVGFLKFLTSGEIDLSVYRDHSRVDRRTMNIEISPLEKEFFDRKYRHRTPPVQLDSWR